MVLPTSRTQSGRLTMGQAICPATHGRVVAAAVVVVVVVVVVGVAAEVSVLVIARKQHATDDDR